jgi:hypothetical protein
MHSKTVRYQQFYPQQKQTCPIGLKPAPSASIAGHEKCRKRLQAFDLR